MGFTCAPCSILRRKTRTHWQGDPKIAGRATQSRSRCASSRLIAFVIDVLEVVHTSVGGIASMQCRAAGDERRTGTSRAPAVCCDYCGAWSG